MTTRVLDTSVAVAWYLPEVFAPRARVWLDRLRAGEARLLVPPLHALEFANVLRTYTRRGELEASLARDIFELHLDAPLTWEEPDRRSLLDIALRYEATVYDASFVALALAHKVPLLTAERTTSPWVVKLGKLAEVLR